MTSKTVWHKVVWKSVKICGVNWQDGEGRGGEDGAEKRKIYPNITKALYCRVGDTGSEVSSLFVVVLVVGIKAFWRVGESICRYIYMQFDCVFSYS